jgi:hypothetical protein
MLISQLDPENKKRALEYQKLYPTEKKNKDSICSFWWRDTSEGENYWKSLNLAIFIDNNKPAHYENGTDKDVIDFCHEYSLNFCKGSAVKYIARAGKKEDEIEDLKKAIDFLQREIKRLER